LYVYLIFWVISILEFKTFLAGTGYPMGKNTHAGTGMGKILYPRAYMGNPMGRIFFDGYGYGMVLPDGYVPVAISRQARHERGAVAATGAVVRSDDGRTHWTAHIGSVLLALAATSAMNLGRAFRVSTSTA
jgi:hypothetical protein